MNAAVTGFILAGGRSRRMGTDKAGLPWNGGTLLEHMIRTLGAVAWPVHVVGREELPDRIPDRGPVEGIAAALAHSGTEHNLVVAVDLPGLEPAFFGMLAARLEQTRSPLLVCSVGGRFPLAAGVRRALLPAVDAYLAAGGRAYRGLVSQCAHETIEEDELRRAGFPPEMFRNLNSPEDYARARRSIDQADSTSA